MKHLPGVVAAIVVMLAGFWLADLIGRQILAAQGLTGSSPLSGVPVAIVLGLLLLGASWVYTRFRERIKRLL